MQFIPPRLLIPPRLPSPGAPAHYRRSMLESVYLAVLIFAFLAIGAMSLFILYKLFAGQE